MLRYSRYRLARGLPLVDEHGSLMLARADGRRVDLVECRSVLVPETVNGLTVVVEIQLEDKGKSVWSIYFGSVTDWISVARTCLAIIAKQLN